MLPENFIENFHFLRPYFLLGLIPAILLVLLLRYLRNHSSSWSRAIEASLLPFLLDSKPRPRQHVSLYGLLLIWMLGIVALAGPTWQRIPVPVLEREDALVIVQDLSLSMYATDLPPSRLVRSQRKLTDILNSRANEGQTALVVYAGDAHTVTPLTTDVATIRSMLPALDPDIMPAPGSRPDLGVELAMQLLENSMLAQGHILLITDGIIAEDIAALSSLFAGSRHTLSIMGMGTEEGAPIPVANNFLRDQQNNIVIPRLNRSLLQQLAASVGGRYSDTTLDDSDINYLLNQDGLLDNRNLLESDQEFDIWLEAGPWLLLFAVPLAALAFRRGWILALLLGTSLMHPAPAHAMIEWRSLWNNSDQLGTQAFSNEEFETAANLFRDDNWRAAAHYRTGNYEAALDLLTGLDGTQAHYNRGNALARLGRLEEAIAAYDIVLGRDPGHADALHNRSLLEELLEQQEPPAEEDGEDSMQQQAQGLEDQDSQEQQEQQASQQAETEPSEENQDQQPEEQGQHEAREQDMEELAEEEREQEAESDPLTEQELADAEDQQALQQWLGRIEDDPRELLRNKFRQQAQQRLYEQLRNPNLREQEASRQPW